MVRYIVKRVERSGTLHKEWKNYLVTFIWYALSQKSGKVNYLVTFIWYAT